MTTTASAPAVALPASPVTAAEIAQFTARLSEAGIAPDDQHASALIDVVASLETLKSAACAVQADATAGFDRARRGEQAAQGVPAARQGRGIAAEIALARRESPHRGQVLLGMAKVLRAEMPHTLARLRDGSLNEFRAMLLVRETACVDLVHRTRIDELLCAAPHQLLGVGSGELGAKARKLVAELDPAGAVRRASNATADRHVSIRPAPDTMVYLTALLPVGQGVACYAALTRAADTARAGGDPRSKGQIMADVLAERLVRDIDPATYGVPVGVNITLPASALAGGHDAATVHAPGVAPVVVPAEIARHLVAAGLTDPTTAVHCWYRCLYADRTGTVIAMTSRSRDFPPGLAEFLALRGHGICANPYCDAPVRHADHIIPVEAGGATTADNGQGLCAACNHAKQAPGWRQRRQPATGEVVTTTPTGHTYPTGNGPSRPPRPAESRPRVDYSFVTQRYKLIA